jgi:putative oxidoreductase
MLLILRVEVLFIESVALNLHLERTRLNYATVLAIPCIRPNCAGGCFFSAEAPARAGLERLRGARAALGGLAGQAVNMSTALRVLRDLALLAARLGLGGILILHGWLRWQGPGQGAQKQIDYLSQFGTPYPRYAAWGAIVLELVGGIFLVVGALTPVVAIAVLVEQVLIIAYTNWYKGPDLVTGDGTYAGGYEYNLTLALLALLLAVFGAGRISVDGLFRRRKPEVEADDDRLS